MSYDMKAKQTLVNGDMNAFISKKIMFLRFGIF